jgi:hypothetical protein
MRLKKLRRDKNPHTIKLHQLYHHFRKEKIKRNKHSARYNERFLEVQQELVDAQMQNKRVIFFDQCHFTNRCDMKLEYSQKKKNISIVR